MSSIGTSSDLGGPRSKGYTSSLSPDPVRDSKVRIDSGVYSKHSNYELKRHHDLNNKFFPEKQLNMGSTLSSKFGSINKEEESFENNLRHNSK